MFNEFLCIDKSISTNKAINLSFIIDTQNIKLGITTFFRRKQDHASIGFQLHLFIFHMPWYIYDKRHWNYHQNRFYRKDEPIEWEYQDCEVVIPQRNVQQKQSPSWGC